MAIGGHGDQRSVSMATSVNTDMPAGNISLAGQRFYGYEGLSRIKELYDSGDMRVSRTSSKQTTFREEDEEEGRAEPRGLVDTDGDEETPAEVIETEAEETISDLPPQSALSRTASRLANTGSLRSGRARERVLSREGSAISVYRRDDSPSPPSRPGTSQGRPNPWEGDRDTGDREALHTGYALDREKSAGRESLVSRGHAEGREILASRGSSSGAFRREVEDVGEAGLEGSSPYARAGLDMERPITRSGRMPTALGGQRPLTSAGRMARIGDMDPAPTRGIHPERQPGDGGGGGIPQARPTTSGRVLTGRPISAALKGAPSTATRLLTAVSAARPGTRTGLTTGRGLSTPISVMDRPITQQGLTGMKTGAQGPKRQVQDKSYFLGILRSKMTELGGEINKMVDEIHIMKKEQSSFLTYDKRVKETAKELTELQGSLADYNLLIDLMNTDTEKLEIDEEFKELQELNTEEANKTEVLFGEKQELESTVRSLEAQLEDERHLGESIIEGMQPELKGRYSSLRSENAFLQQQQEQMQQQIDALNSRKAGLEDEMTLSKVKQEAVGLSERLQELMNTKEQLVQEKTKRGTPQEERERLLLQVKDDNAEIATMERQIGDLQEEMSRLQSDLQSMEQEIDENKSERSQKYRELRRREETMEQFMASFEQSKIEEVDKLDQLENANVELLEKLSRNMMHFGSLPNVAEFDALRGDLAFKEGELEKSRYTVHGLRQEHVDLQANLQKIEVLETKVQKELVDIKEKLRRMETELGEFGDLHGLRSRADVKRKDLAVEKDELEAKKTAVTFSLQEVEGAIKGLKKQLTDNDTHGQLISLEKKWSALEQSNFSIREFVAQKKAESDYLPLKNQAMKIVVDYNKVLQEVVLNGGIIG